MDEPQLHFGYVMHRRLRPRVHRFTVPACFISIPLERLDAIGHRWFGVERARLFSLRYRDYGPGDGTPPSRWLPALLERAGFGDIDGRVVLQTFPRVLGYAFNPVSFWYCHDRGGALAIVVVEVNNTFGERHCYLVRPDGGRARKVFHVSPFFPVAGEYRFRFRREPRRSLARIDYSIDGIDQLHTSISGEARGWSERAFLTAFVRYGWMSVMVIARIHWHALQLFAKRIRFHPKPAPPPGAADR